MQIMHINFAVAVATSWQFVPKLAKTFAWQILHICHFSGSLITYATSHIRTHKPGGKCNNVHKF